MCQYVSLNVHNIGDALSMTTMPDYLILADTCTQYTFNKQDTMGVTVINPGSFNSAKTFTTIYPNKNEVQENSFR